MNKLKNDKLLNALCLNDNDNILITLKITCIQVSLDTMFINPK